MQILFLPLDLWLALAGLLLAGLTQDPRKLRALALLGYLALVLLRFLAFVRVGG